MKLRYRLTAILLAFVVFSASFITSPVIVTYARELNDCSCCPSDSWCMCTLCLEGVGGLCTGTAGCCADIDTDRLMKMVLPFATAGSIEMLDFVPGSWVISDAETTYVVQLLRSRGLTFSSEEVATSTAKSFYNTLTGPLLAQLQNGLFRSAMIGVGLSYVAPVTADLWQAVSSWVHNVFADKAGQNGVIPTWWDDGYIPEISTDRIYLGQSFFCGDVFYYAAPKAFYATHSLGASYTYDMFRDGDFYRTLTDKIVNERYYFTAKIRSSGGYRYSIFYDRPGSSSTVSSVSMQLFDSTEAPGVVTVDVADIVANPDYDYADPDTGYRGVNLPQKLAVTDTINQPYQDAQNTNDPFNQPNPNPDPTDPNPNPDSNPDPNLDPNNPLPELTLPQLITRKFPFSIPWDLYNAFAMLSAPAQSPKWTISLPVRGTTASFTLDFSMFDVWASIIRWGLLIIFNFFLIVATRKLIGAGD